MQRVGESGWLILGSEVKQFEGALSDYWDGLEAVGCGNGLDALEIALRSLGLKPGEPVLTTPLTAYATTLAILRAGGTPVFADVDSQGLIDLEQTSEIVSKRPDIRFFVPVHLYGFSLDLGRLQELRRGHDLRIVEDCAQSIGARFGGRATGTVGQMAATSFYPTKTLGALGDGGAVLTADPALALKARQLRDYGQTEKYVHTFHGLNSRLDELHAAVLADSLLVRLPTFLERRKKVAGRYLESLSNPKLTLPSPPKGSEPAWHLFPLLVEGDRADFQRHLLHAGVRSGQHYPRLANDQQALGGKGETFGELPRAREFAAKQVSIPMHPYLTDAEVDRVIAACNSWKGRP